MSNALRKITPSTDRFALLHILDSRKICQDGFEWVSSFPQGTTAGEIYAACDNPEWLLWLLCDVRADSMNIVAPLHLCIRQALPYAAEDEIQCLTQYMDGVEEWLLGLRDLESARELSVVLPDLEESSMSSFAVNCLQLIVEYKSVVRGPAFYQLVYGCSLNALDYAARAIYTSAYVENLPPDRNKAMNYVKARTVATQARIFRSLVPLDRIYSPYKI